MLPLCRKGLQFYAELTELATKLRASVRSFVAERTTEREALVAKLETEKRLSASTTSPPPLAAKPPLPSPPTHSSVSIDSTLSALRLGDPPQQYGGSPYGFGNSTQKSHTHSGNPPPPPPLRQQSHYSFKPYQATPYHSPSQQQQQQQNPFLPPPHLHTQSSRPPPPSAPPSAPPFDPYASLEFFSRSTTSPPPVPSQLPSTRQNPYASYEQTQPSQHSAYGLPAPPPPPQSYYSQSQPNHGVFPPTHPSPGGMYRYSRG